jgi:hypothetical protein
MAIRAAVVLLLTALAWAGSARAEDDPACAQYHDALSYNLCLAQHGPKANNVGRLRGGAEPGRAAQDRVWYGRNHAPSARLHGSQGARPARGRMHMEFTVH